MIFRFITDITTFENLFELPTEADTEQVHFSLTAPYLRYLQENVLPKAAKQTKAFAEYFERNFGQNYRSLYEFIEINFDVERVSHRKSHSVIIYPNQLWQSAEGVCEELAIFISCILTNWKIPHSIVIQTWRANNGKTYYVNTFVRTQGGFVFDFNAPEIGKHCEPRNCTLESEKEVVIKASILREIFSGLVDFIVKVSKDKGIETNGLNDEDRNTSTEGL